MKPEGVRLRTLLGAKRIFAAFFVAAVVVGIAWVGRIGESRRALSDCDAALARGDHADAIMAARAAAEARCPLSCASELGYARLYAIAKEAEARADEATAFAAWRAVRAATLATALLDVHAARRERADVELARLGHRLDAAAAAAGAPAAAAAGEERLRATLSTSDVPSGASYALLAAGGILFAAGAARFVAAKKALPASDLAVALAGCAVAACGALFF